MDSKESHKVYSITRFNLLTSLLSILNTNDTEDTNFHIAKYILEHFQELDRLSIYDLAEECFVSRSSIQRFVKTIGYDSFTSLKNTVSEVAAHQKTILSYTDYTHYAEHLVSSLDEMAKDIIDTIYSSRWADEFLVRIHDTKNVVVLTAEDSASSIRSLQQDLMSVGKLIRVVTNSTSSLSILQDLTPDDLLVTCSASGNFAIAIREELKDIKAFKALVTFNRSSLFENDYSLIVYPSKVMRLNSREIQSARNVYTRYALSIFFDMFFHGYYRRYISPYQK
ncbi:MAG: MurR/RpiR family transcriptional regulator [Erysipelotrichales bacterium]|nr:MurR/RpiR family transcriptional regulator [Erysipelotrichales bacterium]MBQ4375558.1 MurR/RpiR family transcriptional regulator [Erysipelotrichales bacterium]